MWHKSELPGRQTNLVLALAYNTVLLEFLQDNALYNKYSLIREHTMLNKMTHSQIEQAYNVSDQLLQALYQKGIVYAYPTNSPLD